MSDATTTPTTTRIVTATVSGGRVAFNQVVMEQDPNPPAGVLLAGWDQAAGVYIWRCAQEKIARHSAEQARGYSRCVPGFSVRTPPFWLGPPTFYSKTAFASWPTVDGLATNAKRAAIITALKAILPL